MKELYHENFKALKKKVRKIPEDRMTSSAQVRTRLILWKCVSYQKQSRDSV